MADTELRRRHPEVELPPLHADDEPEVGDTARPATGQASTDTGSRSDRPSTVRLDVKAAVEAARKAERIIAERQRRADRGAGLDSDDVMRQREMEAEREASERHSAVRQEPTPSRHMSAELDELELEAGQ